MTAATVRSAFALILASWILGVGMATIGAGTDPYVLRAGTDPYVLRDSFGTDPYVLRAGRRSAS